MLQPKRKRKATPLDSFVGAKLKERRDLIGASQGSLGEIIGVSFQQIQKYEKGIDRLSAGDLYKLSRFLQIPIHYFFQGYEPSDSFALNENQPSPYQASKLDEETKELLCTYSQISDPQLKRKVIDFAKSLISKT
jgi:transcriptional regulator with XRE-family HTH domain